ncbi:CopG family transcriptional regulator [Candidatus Bipolaricaulota bacterium]|nr:CopG family transcriptional regulator [Candidatus Bipolaricaulota bacterium]
MDQKKRIQVTFSHKQWELIEKFRGELGEKDADIIRNIVIAWLAEKSIICSKIKSKIKSEEIK